MRVALFFVYLCFLLLKAGDPVHAVASAGAAPQFQSSQTVDYATAFHGLPVIHTANADQNGYFAGDDAEDEDTENIFTRKVKLPARCYEELVCQPVPAYPLNRSKAAPSFCGRIAPKYILQRVLRV